jgi:rfaE bifunctional protein kinase chain/domain
MPFPVTRQRLCALVDGFAGRRIAVAGDFVLDRFLHGRPKRISREAPVLILKFVEEQSLPGGGANTAANLAALSGVPFAAGAVGEDPEGELLKSLFRARGIDPSLLVPVGSYPTPTKTRILGGGTHSIKQQIVRLDREESLPSDGGLVERLKKNLLCAVSGAEVLVLSDYGYGSCRPEWIAEARKARPRLKILVDSRFRLADYRGADAATPNEEELERSTGAALGDSEQRFDEAARALLSKISSRALLVTRGSRGMALFEDGKPPVSIPVHGTDQVADVTGAGDTVMAAFALSLAAGASFLEAALLSNFAGGVVVMKMGTATVTPEELKAAITADRKILG